MLKKIENLDVAKASQQTDIPTKLLKLNSKYFSKFIVENLNFCIVNSEFPSDLKLADVIPIYKKNSKHSKYNYRSVAFYLTFQKYMKGQSTNNYNLILKIYFLNFNVDFEKVIMLNIVY